MEKKEISILKSGIEVPPVVQKKADAAFAAIQKERTETMENKDKKQQRKKKQGKTIKLIKPVIAVAACAALFVGAGRYWGGGSLPGQNAVVGEADGETMTPQNENGEAADQESAQAIRNWFTLTACAKELEPGIPVPMPLMGVGNSGRSWALSGSADEGTVDYSIATDFLCQGENIERVSYSISKGAFQVIQPADPAEQIVVEGQLFDGELNTASIGGAYDESSGLLENSWEMALYQSYTLDYDRQSAEQVWINICNECYDSWDIQALIWGEGGAAKTLEEMSEGINRMLDGVVITCTAYYADGTSQSVEIEVGSSVMTYGEAGEDADSGIPQDEEGVFITFEVK